MAIPEKSIFFHNGIMHFVTGLILLLSLPSFACPLKYNPNDSSTTRISDIIIENGEIFTDSLSDKKGLYKLANQLHIRTKKRLISKYILLNIGDSLDEPYRAESERLLRRRSFITNATVKFDTISPDSVVLRVTTTDAWSLIMPLELGTGGGLTTFGAGLEEHNFLGYGKNMFLYGYYESDVGWTKYIGYEDELLFGTPWKFGIEFEDGPLSNGYKFNIGKPFFYSNDKWSYGIKYKDRRDIQRTFDQGDEVFRFNRDMYNFKGRVVTAMGERYKKWRMGITYEFYAEDYSPITENSEFVMPLDDEIYATAFVISKENFKFYKEKYLDNFHITEDISVGRFTLLSIGKGSLFNEVGSERWEVNAYRNERFRFSKGQYFRYTIDLNHEQGRASHLKIKLKYLNRITKRQTLAIGLKTFYGDNLDLHDEYLLGGNNGLRGYKARLLQGSKLALLNIEDRIFAPWEVLGIGFGMVAFYDMGYVWKENETPRIDDIKASIGLGLRIGFFTFPDSPVLRTDYGVPLDGSTPFISIGFEQQF